VVAVVAELLELEGGDERAEAGVEVTEVVIEGVVTVAVEDATVTVGVLDNGSVDRGSDGVTESVGAPVSVVSVSVSVLVSVAVPLSDVTVSVVVSVSVVVGAGKSVESEEGRALEPGPTGETGPGPKSVEEEEGSWATTATARAANRMEVENFMVVG